MQTRTLISLIQREATSWSRELIRSLINDIHNKMMSHPMQQTRIIDGTTGTDPYLATTSPTLQYYANTANIGANAWKIDRVYTGNISDGSDETVSVFTTIGTYSNPARITFQSDPGTHATSYKVRAFKIPTEISSESVELEVPQEHHDLVYEGVMAWIEKTDNGKSVERWKNFVDSMLPQFWWKMNDTISQDVSTRYKGGY